MCTPSTSHVKLTSYVRMLAKTNTTRVPGKSYCPGDNMYLCRTLVARSNKGKPDLCEPPFHSRSWSSEARQRATQSQPRAEDSIMLSAMEKNVFMVASIAHGWSVCCMSHGLATGHNTHSHLPQDACEGPDPYAACRDQGSP